MSEWKHEIRRRLANLRLEPAREAEIVDELAGHLEDRYNELRASGENTEEARRKALAELQNSDLMARELRKTEPAEPFLPASQGNFFSGMAGDFRYAFRTLRKSPGFTLFVVLALSLGIGANTAVFTLINTLLLNPLPVKDLPRLVALDTQSSKDKGANRLLPLSWLNLKDYEKRNEVFTEVAGYSSLTPMTLSGNEKSERVIVELVTANYFETLGLHPALGRFFLPEEDRIPGAAPLAVLGYSAWQNRFGGAQDIIGRTLRLDNQEVTVVGVAPEGFKGITVVFGPDLWMPSMMAEQAMLGHKKALRDRGDLLFHAAARLKPSVPISQAQANVQTIATALNKEYPELNQSQTVAIRPLVQAAQGDYRQPLLFGSVVLMGVVALVLLIACSNAASLFLARASGRRQEIAVRLALGASRKQLIRQLLMESTLLALSSGAAGLVIAYEGCQLLWSFRPPEVAHNFVDPKLDISVVAFTVFVALLTGIIFGLVPALQSSRPDVIDAIKEEARTAGQTRRRVTFRNVLLVGQVALSLVSLVTAALFLRSIEHAYTIDIGFQTDHLAMFTTDQGRAGYNRDRAEEFYREIRAQVSALPGVVSVTWASNLPFWNSMSRSISIEGQVQLRKQDALPVLANTVDLDFFTTLGTPFLEGRDFAASDREGSVLVAIVNQTAAEKYWPNQNVLGKRFQLFGKPEYRQIIGVVKTANYTSLGEDPQPCVFLPLRQNFSQGLILYVRTNGSPSSILTPVQRELRRFDSQLDVSDTRTGTKLLDQALFFARLGVELLSVFGLLGLGLASVGLYGVIAYSVNQRQREIGVRVALGATRGDVLQMIVRQGMMLVATGVLLGFAISLLVGRAVSKLLFGIHAIDPISLLASSSVLLLIALIACYIPAYRASRLDPLVALRDR